MQSKRSATANDLRYHQLCGNVRVSEYLSLTYPITLYPEPDGGYTVMMTDLVGCISQGDTLEEAMANIQEAKIAWMETAWEYGDEISLPSQFWRSNV